MKDALAMDAPPESPIRNAAPESNRMESAPRSNRRTFYFVGLLAVLALGIFLRLPPDAFRDDHSLIRLLAPLHPTPKFQTVGFDEGLYRAYVNDLIREGLSAYPDFAEHYVERQQKLPSAILPPTRFLYIFCGYLWHEATGAEALVALHNISSLFSMLLLIAAAAFAWRVAGEKIGLCILALMSCAPTQIHMSQHALVDGFFAFWATLCLWFLWENLRRPNDRVWLTLYTASLALMVLTKENAAFAYCGLLVLLGANRWLRFGTVTRPLLLLTFVGPLLGVVALISLCGGAGTFYRTYQLLVSKAATLPYAIATGDGPWYRYMLDLMLISPVIFLLAWGAIFRLKLEDKGAVYFTLFVAATYLFMCNVRYGMNLRYTNMWDLPLRYLALISLQDFAQRIRWRQDVVLAVSVAAVCALDLRQYHIFFVEHDLYELVTGGLLRALQILK